MDTILIKTVKAHTTPIRRCGLKFTNEPKPITSDLVTAGEMKRIIADPALEGLHPETGDVLFTGGKLVSEDADAPKGTRKVKTETPSVSKAALNSDALEGRLAETILLMKAEEFTNSGQPDVKVLKKALPDDADKIDAKLRDKVWEAMQKDGAKIPDPSGVPS